MPVNVNVQRLALQKVRVTEVHLAPLPPLPPALARIHGVTEWWNQMLQLRERDQEALYRALLTPIDTATTTETTTIDAADSAALDAETAARIAADNALDARVDVLEATPPGAVDESLIWINL